jgi:hypothetical protein
VVTTQAPNWQEPEAQSELAPQPTPVPQVGAQAAGAQP